MKDNKGLPIGTSNDNPILDTRIYKVEYLDGHKAALSANMVAQNRLAQVDEEGNRYVLFDEIVDARVDRTQVTLDNGFIYSANGGKGKRKQLLAGKYWYGGKIVAHHGKS